MLVNYKIYKSYFDAAQELILVFDSRGVLILTNNKLEIFTGYSEKLCLGKSYLELPFFTHTIHLYFAKYLKNNTKFIREKTFIISPTDEKKYVQIQISKNQDSTNEDIGFSCKIWADLSIRESTNLTKDSLQDNLGYKTIFDNSPEAIMIIDTKGYILNANKKVEELTSYSSKYIINRHFKNLEFITADSQEILAKNFKQGVLGKHLNPYEIKIIRKNKQITIGRISGSQIKSPKGDIIGFIVIIANITEKKQLENELKREKEFSSLIFEESINAILIVNEKKKVVTANKKALKLLGRKKTDVIANHCSNFFQSETPCPYDYNKKDNDNYNCELIRPNGEKITINKSVSTFQLNGERYILESFTDISKQIKIEQALFKSKERYKQLTENNDEVFWAVDSKNPEHLTYVSPAFEKVWGISVMELYSNPHLWKNTIHEEDQAYVSSEFNRFFRKEKKLNIKYRIYHKDGTIRWIWNKGFFMNTSSEQTTTFAGIIQDVTLQYLTREALLESSKKYKSLFEFVADSLLIIDPKTLFITDANEAACEMYQYNYSELLGKRITELCKIPENTILAVESGDKRNFDLLHKRKNNEIFPIELKSRKILIEDQNIYLCSIQDVSRHRDLKKKMLKIAIETEERERKHIAENLHDDIGPFLSAIMMYVYELSSDNIKADQKQILLKYLEEMIDQAILNTKAIAYSLTPAVLSDYGLIKALENFCTKMNQLNKTYITFVVSSYFRIDMIIETIIYRIITELVNNSLKHSKTDNIYLYINKIGQKLHIEYKDYGIGFDLQKALKQDKGLGLRNILNRLNSIHGTYSFETTKDQGITFKFIIELGD